MTQEDALLAEELAAEAVASQEETPAPTLERMEALAAEVNTLDDRIAKGEEILKQLKDRRYAILSGELIEMMDGAHVQAIQVGGRQFKAMPYYKAVIPTAEGPDHPGLDWLEENGAGDLINNIVTAQFPRGAVEEAKLAVDLLRKRFQMAQVTRQRTTHHMTLTAWLRELHQSGDPNKVMPPLELIGGIIGRIVKITSARG